MPVSHCATNAEKRNWIHGGSNPFRHTKIMTMEAIYADTWIELTVKMLGYHHDHCWHYYAGKTINVPEKYKELITGKGEYVFIFEEAIPNNYNMKDSDTS